METHSSDPSVELLIDQPLNRLKRNIEEIDKIRSIGKDILDFSIASLKILSNESKNHKYYGIERKIDSTIKALEGIGESNINIKEKMVTINNQSLVLLVSNFERFLSDFTVLLVEEYAYLINWPEKKFSIDFGAFKHGMPSLGEVVLKSLREKYSFQDLKSILEYTKEIFDVDILLEDSVRDRIIYLHALRNILVHNLGIVDTQFLKQTRNINPDIAGMFCVKGEQIDVSEDRYFEAKTIFIEFASKIHSEVRKEMAPF